MHFLRARGFIPAMPRLLSSLLLAALLLGCPPARADIEVPPRVLEPLTVPEAWNVIRLARSNVERLLAEKRPEEATPQVSLCSPAIRTLVRLASSQEMKVRLDELAVRAFGYINHTAAGGLESDLTRTQAGFTGLRGVLDQMAGLFDPAVVQGEIYVCPDDPDFVSTDAGALCDKCRQRLVPRRIPYSFVYTAPSAPALGIAATADAPLQAGRPATVTLRLTRLAGGAPVEPRDLLREHGQRIHALLVDPGLTDFQRHHPEPTATPGEYRFTFTPQLTSPYQLWVDVTPAETGLPEVPRLELPSRGTAALVAPLDDTRESQVGDLRFRLTFDDRRGLRPRPQETRIMRLTVTQADGQPVTRLEPYMLTFAHLTGFYEDSSALVRLHAAGQKILRREVRGGPVLGFRLHAPKAGRIRFFCEIMVDGKLVVAPVDVSISP